MEEAPAEQLVERLGEISSALELLASESAVDKERADLLSLQAAIQTATQGIDKEVYGFTCCNLTCVQKQDVATRRLATKLQSTLSELSGEIERVDKKIGSAMHLLRDGIRYFTLCSC